MMNILESCYILSIDTTSKYCSISLLNKGNVLSEYHFISDGNLSSIIIPSIDFMMGNLKIDLKDINVFGIGIGPGLFTGIRIGLSTLKGMLFDSPIPVIPVNNLEVLASKFKQLEISIVTIIDAKRDEIYVGAYNFCKNGWVEIFAPDLIHITELELKLKRIKNFHFTGDGVEIHRNFLNKTFKNSKQLDQTPFFASEIGKMAFEKYKKNEYILNLKDLKPYYLRKPDAEKKQIKK